MRWERRDGQNPLSTSHFLTNQCIQRIESHIVDRIRSAGHRWTRPELVRYLVRQQGLNPRLAKSAIENLLIKNEIAYSYQFGSSFLEVSFNRPVRISKTLVVKPPECSCPEVFDQVVIDMMPGAAFGSGQHPTTQLALEGLDFLIHEKKILSHQQDTTVLDIGTGSGILLIAAIKLGMISGVGIDIDPCARAEARTNIALNGIQSRTRITKTPIENIAVQYFLIMANLRYPTIDRLLPHLMDCLRANGFLLLSGIKTEELYELQKKMQKTESMESIWQSKRSGWAALAAKKRNPINFEQKVS
jgi:ribosomal protein L11 methyltransferase